MGLLRWCWGKESVCQCKRSKETLVQPLGPQDPREEETVCPSVLAWRIPRTEESLVRYRTRGREDSDRTEPRSTEGRAETDALSYRKWSCRTSGDTSPLGTWTQPADSMRFSVSYGSELLPLPSDIVLSLVPVITKFLRRKSSLCFLSGRYCHSFHFMIIPEKNFLVWERSVLKDDLLWASNIPSTPLGSKPNTQSVSTQKKYKKWSRENNDLFVDGYILINEQILFAIQRFGVGSFFLMPTIK